MIKNPQFERLTPDQQTQIKHVITKDFKASKILFDTFLQQQYSNEQKTSSFVQKTIMKD